jgi:hypothetical protein
LLPKTQPDLKKEKESKKMSSFHFACHVLLPYFT